MARRVVRALLLLALAGCGRCSSEPGKMLDAGADASADASAPRASTVLLGGDLDLDDVRWASNGDVIATTRIGVLRFAPEAGASAKLLRIPDEDFPARLATSRESDVVAVVTQFQRLYVSRDGGALREIEKCV